jgi:hypothetical protein
LRSENQRGSDLPTSRGVPAVHQRPRDRGTDIGGATDVLASLYGTEKLLLAMLEAPEVVAPWLARLTEIWKVVYEAQARLLPAENGCKGWLSYWSSLRTYPLQNDFSCMISPSLFRELCVPELESLATFIDRPFYHLDGPDAVKHLDTLLELPQIQGIQWQPGAAGGTATDWLPLLQRIQQAGKRLFIYVRPEGLETVMSALRPEGVVFSLPASSPEEADALVKKVAQLATSRAGRG